MDLLPKELAHTLPRLYETEDTPLEETVLYLRYYSPYVGWEWYVAEYCPEEKVFFGWVRGFDEEWGYFSLEELEELQTSRPYGVILDPTFTPTKFKDLKTA